MNCKPGDLAVIVAEDLDCACNIGAMLRVVQLHPSRTLRPMWEFRDESRPLKMTDGGADVRWSSDPEVVGFIADCYLVPIRDPGGEKDRLADVVRRVTEAA